MIEIQNVSRRYGSSWALKNISLSIEKNSVLGLLGQNGAGKTTLLNIMTGFLAPTRGQVLIDGEDVLLSPQSAKEKIGYLPELPPLYDEMSIREYLCFVSGLRGVTPRAVSAHVEEIMRLTGVWELRERLIGHLSKGYRQRVGFAQALCGDCEVLVLDEPTVGLDPKQIAEIRELIRSLSPGRTIVFSSHILSEVEELCDRVVILHEGEVRLCGKLNELGGSKDGVVLRCVFGAEESAVFSRLKRLEGLNRIEKQASDVSGECAALLRFHGIDRPERRLFALCSDLGIPILALAREEKSLERIFLNVISGKENS